MGSVQLGRSPHESDVITAAVAVGAGTGQNVSEYSHIDLFLATASSANGTIQFQGSMSHTEPTWASAQSVTNRWDYIQVVDLEDGAGIDGDTGIALTGTDDFRLLEANVNGLKWVNARITTWSAGAWTVKARPFKE